MTISKRTPTSALTLRGRQLRTLISLNTPNCAEYEKELETILDELTARINGAR